MIPILALMDLGSHTWWSQPGLWAAVILVVLAAKVPGRTGAMAEEEQRLLVRRLLRAGPAAWLLFHVWAAWSLVACLRNLRLISSPTGSADYALGLDIVGRKAFSGWACLGGAIVLAGIADRQREVRWKRGVLLAASVGVVGASILFSPARTIAFETRLPIPAGWEERTLPALGFAIFVSLICVVGASVGAWRAHRNGAIALAEDRRLLLAGAGLVLLSAGVMFALVRGFGACETVVRLGPKLTPKDIDYLLWTPFRAPAVPVLLGLLATVFGLVHLKRPRDVGGMSGEPQS